MPEAVSVPEELVGSFNRMMRRVPVDLRNDEEMPATILAYLKLGGERLARQALAAMDESHRFENAKKKQKLREEALLRAAEFRKLEAAERENEEDGDGDGDGDKDTELDSDDTVDTELDSDSTELDGDSNDPDEDLEVF